jgi:hypothetical protein
MNLIITIYWNKNLKAVYNLGRGIAVVAQVIVEIIVPVL